MFLFLCLITAAFNSPEKDLIKFSNDPKMINLIEFERQKIGSLTRWIFLYFFLFFPGIVTIFGAIYCVYKIGQINKELIIFKNFMQHYKNKIMQNKIEEIMKKN